VLGCALEGTRAEGESAEAAGDMTKRLAAHPESAADRVEGPRTWRDSLLDRFSKNGVGHVLDEPSLLGEGAARKRVSSAGQSNPSPAYGPVATASSGVPPGLGSSRASAAIRALAPMPPCGMTGSWPKPRSASASLSRCAVQLVRMRQVLRWDSAADGVLEGGLWHVAALVGDDQAVSGSEISDIVTAGQGQPCCEPVWVRRRGAGGRGRGACLRVMGRLARLWPARRWARICTACAVQAEGRGRAPSARPFQ
jgi:hypothetical protein